MRYISLIILVIVQSACFMPRYSDGETTANFSGLSPMGKKIELLEFRGQIVLLDFWGSWCPDCRRANPELVWLYKNYHNKAFKAAKNFTIISVANERSRESWARAVVKDSLIWEEHILEMSADSTPITSLYKVRRFPTQYLIDENGAVVGVDLPLAETDAYLKGRLQ